MGSINVLLTKPLVPLIALSFDHQNHSKWHKWCHVRYNLPFLVIDDNTIKASIKFAIIDKFNHLIPIETTYTCLDAYHHCFMFVTISPIIQWWLGLPLKPWFSPFVPPLMSLFLPHDLIHLAFLPLWNREHFSPFVGNMPCFDHISPPLESNHLKGLAKQYSSRED